MLLNCQTPVVGSGLYHKDTIIGIIMFWFKFQEMTIYDYHKTDQMVRRFLWIQTHYYHDNTSWIRSYHKEEILKQSHGSTVHYLRWKHANIWHQCMPRSSYVERPTKLWGLTHWSQTKWPIFCNIFKCIFLNENCFILFKISLKFARKGPNKSQHCFREELNT